MLCGNYILSNRSEWTFYFLSSVQFNFTIGERIKNQSMRKIYLHKRFDSFDLKDKIKDKE